MRFWFSIGMCVLLVACKPKPAQEDYSTLLQYEERWQQIPHWLSYSCNSNSFNVSEETPLLDGYYIDLADSMLTSEEWGGYFYSWGFLNQLSSPVFNKPVNAMNKDELAAISAHLKADTILYLMQGERIGPTYLGESFYPGIYSGNVYLLDLANKAVLGCQYLLVYSSRNLSIPEIWTEQQIEMALQADFESQFDSVLRAKLGWPD